jgi:hypothetical protein
MVTLEVGGEAVDFQNQSLRPFSSGKITQVKTTEKAEIACKHPLNTPQPGCGGCDAITVLKETAGGQAWKS